MHSFISQILKLLNKTTVIIVFRKKMIHSRYKVCKFEDKTDHAELVNEHMKHVIIELV